ncbi:16S rRNA (guanine(966)-N(2))-methyltransferase RsmD [Flagellimonas halotolerans]|uniref:16S rRNA (Guanine(966)-N(2))-methyltransferase RsmD n=1 Tax=Flagellimonas halotolerans TaxID=3112164 RepID=A0ABU6IRM3_9FLAO|nr:MULTISPECIES: 16S rRNA (guanine(966)-N(2))-methyltransferase RsmD [unclassified Allomuricauda]MEC3965786.1 16S rRNA (guanine(966)-N(2))-methyltransferase RsmD [Muricauda sp. SYSU M86414]MEC4265748.1 16S rRNA (guanine(966)-N(2))-methyltransferase RsmD [Muricauda sp. SYSU M84420]
MRIISGKYKGKRLTAPKKLPVRPTTDMAKEALFNILNNRFYFDELKVLDLFSGTGNIGFEFASRGTQKITAVDGHQGCVRYISKTAQQLDFSINTVKSDVFKFLQGTPDKFDLIFADPPYDFDTEQFLNIANLVFEQGLLLDDGLLIIEHSDQTNLSEHPKFSEQRKYGGSIFSFFEVK